MMKYTKAHEWIHVEGRKATIGISQYGRQELGEIVYVELPKVGKKVTAGDEVVVLESTKAAADFYSPVSGKILKVNDALKKDIMPLNAAPESDGWLYEIELTAPGELENLLNLEEYKALSEN